jgi:hypothetical protein
MPFWYDIPVPAVPVANPGTLRLLNWLVEEEEEFHAGTPLAILESSGERFAVLANGDGFIRDRLFPTGAELKAGIPMAIANADGESIPYGRPYSIAQRIEAPGKSKM